VQVFQAVCVAETNYMSETAKKDVAARSSPGRAVLKHLTVVMPDSKTHLIFWSLMAGGLALDLWTKKLAFEHIESHEALPVIDGFVQLVRALNNGAAFGWFSGKSYFLAGVSLVALGAILVVFLFGGSRQRLVHVALGFFAAGVCGNMYDRIFNNGYVRDFIDVYYRSYHWHTFNVADALLCMGVGLLIISTVLTERPVQKRDQQRK